jgi:hypothetical protein
MTKRFYLLAIFFISGPVSPLVAQDKPEPSRAPVPNGSADRTASPAATSAPNATTKSDKPPAVEATRPVEKSSSPGSPEQIVPAREAAAVVHASSPDQVRPAAPASAPPSGLSPRVAEPRPAVKSPAAAEPIIHRPAGAALAIALVYERAWVDDRGYGLFGDRNRVRQFGVWVGHDFWSLTDRLIMAGEAGWAAWDERSDYWEEQLETSLVTSSLHVGVSLRYVLEPWLQPQLRAAVGLSVLELELKSLENDLETKFLDRHLMPFASVGAGIFLRTPTRLLESKNGDFASLSMGVLVEGGYTLTGSAPFSLKPKDRPKQAISLKSADLGSVDRSGPYVRISLVVRF